MLKCSRWYIIDNRDTVSKWMHVTYDLYNSIELKKGKKWRGEFKKLKMWLHKSAHPLFCKWDVAVVRINQSHSNLCSMGVSTLLKMLLINPKYISAFPVGFRRDFCIRLKHFHVCLGDFVSVQCVFCGVRHTNAQKRFQKIHWAHFYLAMSTFYICRISRRFFKRYPCASTLLRFTCCRYSQALTFDPIRPCSCATIASGPSPSVATSTRASTPPWKRQCQWCRGAA